MTKIQLAHLRSALEAALKSCDASLADTPPRRAYGPSDASLDKHAGAVLDFMRLHPDGSRTKKIMDTLHLSGSMWSKVRLRLLDDGEIEEVVMGVYTIYRPVSK